MHWTEPATAAARLARLNLAVHGLSGERSGATWTLPQERPKGERGGAHQFYTPTSIVRLIVEILEPYHGRILDPACGSGGMFIQSARFVEPHQKNPTAEISVHGQERVTDTARLARLNLAVHGLSGDVKQGWLRPRSFAIQYTIHHD